MSIFTQFRDWLLAPLTNSEKRKAIARVDLVREYYVGDQTPQLKRRPNQIDYNAIANVIKTIIDDSVSLLFGYGVKFDLPGEGETPQDEYLKEVWDLSKQQILLHDVAKTGAETGTCAIKIIENGVYSSKLGKKLPRLQYQDSVYLEIKTEPNDLEQHTQYTIEYAYQKDGKDAAHKQEIIRLISPDETITWQVIDYEYEKNDWIKVGDVVWPRYFPPLVVWQNLPNTGDAKGLPDVTDDTLRGQDKLNFVLSDTIKTNSLYAHPKLVAKNASLGNSVDGSPDALIEINGPDADMSILEMNSEMAGSLALFDKIKTIMYESTGTTDTAALLGTGDMTNFRVKIAYQKALQKLNIKRQLYGDALLSLNKYLLILAGSFGDDPDPGKIIWPDVLPVNETEQSNGLKIDLENGIVSKQTASEKRGYNWENEQKRIADEKTSEGDIGTNILEAFNRGA